MLRTCAVCGRSFDWEPRQSRPPMTCSRDCQRERKNVLSVQSRQRAAKRGCPDDMHGTMTSYTHYLCGCPTCTRWAREYQQARRAKAKGAT
jgi:hypothetical protein